MTGSGLPRRMKSALGRARAVLIVERLWPALWPPLGAALMFLTFAFFDLAARMPGWAHAAVLAGFAAVFSAAVWRAARGFKPVGAGEARRRLERDSGLGHQPLAALEDNLALGAEDPAAQALWAAHRARAAQAAGRLSVSAPAPAAARLDPRALRAAVILVFAAGVGAVWNASPSERLMRALIPDLSDGSARLVSAQVWITPPSYTGAAPVTLVWPGPGAESESRTAGPVSVPAGGAVLVRIVGGEAPVLNAAGTRAPFESLGRSETGAAWRAEAVIGEGGGVVGGAGGESVIAVVSGGETAAAWPVRVQADQPPSVEYTAPPAADGPRLRLPYESADDYGVTGLDVVIRRAEAGAESGAESGEIRAPLPLARPGGKISSGAPSRDFSAHLWAGTEVLVTLEAEDAAGQTGAAEPFRMVLPFRLFNHPAARALAEARRELLTPSPGVVKGVIETLDDLSAYPARFYDDVVVFLGLRVARGRLRSAGGEDGAVRQVQALLWDLALRIEDGEYALAEREMLEAHSRLQQAMQDGADNAEIEHLIDDLMQSLNQFLEAAREEMARAGGEAPPVSDMQITDARALADMIRRARELARLGDMEGAQRLMAELGRILESIQSAARGGAQTAEDIKRAREAMDGLRSLSERQRGLLDESFEKLHGRSGALPPPGGEADQGGEDGEGAEQKGGAQAQSALRRDLGETMLQMDELMGAIPGGLGEAERAMRRAEQGLEDGDLPGAVRAQGDALSNLQSAMDAAAEKIARRFGAMGLPGEGPGAGRRRGGADPFGRGRGGPMGAASDDGSVQVPGEMEIRRAHEILDELRRRAGDRGRPAEERGYIDRLLKRFR